MADQEQEMCSSGHIADDPSPAKLMPAQKFAKIQALKRKEMLEGETWFVVDHPWFHNWEVACTGQSGKETPVAETDIRPVDNSRIVDANGNLVENVIEGVNVEYVPEPAWKYLEQW
jgi:ubiquitin carboxyl-terminal hydrolase 4/11/15